MDGACTPVTEIVSLDTVGHVSSLRLSPRQAPLAIPCVRSHSRNNTNTSEATGSDSGLTPCEVTHIKSGKKSLGSPFGAQACEAVQRFSSKFGLTSSAPVSDAFSNAAETTEVTYLDNVLCQEFAGASDVDDSPDLPKGRSDVSVMSTTSWRSKSVWARIAEHRYFSVFFMVLTFYALFAPDMDMIWGDKTSQEVLLVVTTIVVILFAIEILLQSMGKKGYLGAAYFWLDLVSLISLLPETYLLQEAFSQQNLAAGRSTRLTRIIRVASRSSKAARLNRLSRIVRVAALMPRIQRLFGKGVKDDATEKLLEKKIGRIFSFMDEDLDGFVARQEVGDCIGKIRQITGATTSTTWASKVTSQVSSQMSIATRATSVKTLAGTVHTVVSHARSGLGQITGHCTRMSPHQSDVDGNSLASPTAQNPLMVDGLMNYAMFRKLLLEDDMTSSGMRRACKNQIRGSNNMQNLTAKHSEYIGVKVALCVLLLLFVLTFVETVGEDHSEAFGLSSLDGFARMRNSSAVPGDSASPLLAEQVRIWSQQDFEDDWGMPRTIMYLDLNRLLFCNEIAGLECYPANTSSVVWGPRRTSLERLDEMTKEYQNLYQRRWQDFVWIRHPSGWDEDYTLEQLDVRVTAVALLDLRETNRTEGIGSVLMTLVVIVIILSGIFMLTKDLTFLSKNLLAPLVDLADEMESITRLQLAGVSATAEDNQLSAGTSEVRLIRRAFENMKKAIKSWGKYVPWPVVQSLLRADVEASIDVEEKEVSIFFSDIASFTTIVEGLAPEKSLLLLSRYFHDMSKIIDEFGGIVLEFIGDAIMSIYGAPVRNDDHATSAVRASIKMLAALRSMNRWFADRNLPQVSIRCGVHTGPALVGNMGFASRMKYGAVGEHSNVPGHLEESNKNYETEFLISEATYRRLTKPEAFVIRPVDVMNLVADCEPQVVYQVMERSSRDPHLAQKRAAAAVHTKAMNLYRGRAFAEAAEKFGESAALFEAATGQPDAAAKLLLKRSLIYADMPPAPAWDGVWDRPEK